MAGQPRLAGVREPGLRKAGAVTAVTGGTGPGTGASVATDVAITDVGGYFSGGNVELALQETGAVGAANTASASNNAAGLLLRPLTADLASQVGGKGAHTIGTVSPDLDAVNVEDALVELVAHDLANAVTAAAASAAAAATATGAATAAATANAGVATNLAAIALRPLTTDLAAVTAGKGAALIGIQDAGLLITATTVEGAFAELGTSIVGNTAAIALRPLTTDLAAVTPGKGASLISIQDALNLIAATTVEGALAELATSIASNVTAIGLRPLTTDLAAVTAAKGASLIGIQDAAALITAVTVEGALAELATSIVGASSGTIPLTRGGTGQITAAASYDALTVTAPPITCAATIDLSLAGCPGNYVVINGATGPVTSLGTAPAGTGRILRFAGAPTITHNAVSLILPGAANIVAAAGDVMFVHSLGAGNWRCTSYMRAASMPAMVADLSSVAAGKGASTIGIQDALNIITATTVEGALAELATLRADLASGTAGKGAGLVTTQDLAGVWGGPQTVENAIFYTWQRAALSARTIDLASQVNSFGASLIGIEDAGSLILALNVEGALAEIATNVAGVRTMTLTTGQKLALNLTDATNTADTAALKAPEVVRISHTTTGTTTTGLGAQISFYLKVAGGTERLGATDVVSYVTPTNGSEETSRAWNLIIGGVQTKVIQLGAFVGFPAMYFGDPASSICFYRTGTTVAAYNGITSAWQMTNAALIHGVPTLMSDRANVTPVATASGVLSKFAVTPGADVGTTTLTEAFDIDFNLSRTRTWANGNVAMQRAIRIKPQTIAFVSGSNTVTTASTVAIEGAPIPGAFAVITQPLSLHVQAGAVRFDGNFGFQKAAVGVQSTTGTNTGFVAVGAGSGAVSDVSTFTGGSGATAYRISDVVLALKNLGWLAA